ncbi:hypothetical protein RJ640_024541 [Escallonia rubra]|uniref:ATP-dependent Clp protease proteolytic subunit n=1 Tax=Escallonia rubra TaxID=112253 RepID=A0AA88UR44_9ASTE|nr:hypothetical protein RJ640_024541 [Escallonia rubra]
MEVLSLSTPPLPSHSLSSPSLKPRTSLYKPPSLSVRQPPLKCSLASPQTQTTAFKTIVGQGFDFPGPSFAFQSSPPSATAPQTPATAMRGAETDAMGLLLRERIVFLGNTIDDFVADAIISQLLLLDAQDPTKDIRLFINSAGGSLRRRCSFMTEVPSVIVALVIEAVASSWKCSH